VGATVPATIDLNPMPLVVAEKVPQIKSHLILRRERQGRDRRPEGEQDRRCDRIVPPIDLVHEQQAQRAPGPAARPRERYRPSGVSPGAATPKAFAGSCEVRACLLISLARREAACKVC
jgi:hypothetical protein